MTDKKLKEEVVVDDEVEDKDVGLFGGGLEDVSAGKIIDDVLEQDKKFMEDITKNIHQSDDEFSQGLFNQEKKKKKDSE